METLVKGTVSAIITLAAVAVAWHYQPVFDFALVNMPAASWLLLYALHMIGKRCSARFSQFLDIEMILNSYSLRVRFIAGVCSTMLLVPEVALVAKLTPGLEIVNPVAGVCCVLLVGFTASALDCALEAINRFWKPGVC